MLYTISANTAVEWRGEILPGENVRHPLNIEQLWSEAELNSHGLYKLTAADAIPEGKQAQSSSVQVVNGQPKTVYVLEDIPEPSPSDYVLTARQIRLGLIRHNVSLATVQSAINAITDSQQRDEAQVYWDYSTAILWDHPMTQALLTLSGIPEANAAAMWLVAKDYEA